MEQCLEGSKETFIHKTDTSFFINFIQFVIYTFKYLITLLI